MEMLGFRGLIGLSCLGTLLFTGCTSVYRGKLLEPGLLPEEQYANPVFVQESHRVPVALILDDCPDNCQIVYEGVMGGKEIIQNVDLRQIVEREFSKMIRANFSEASVERAPLLVFRVDVSRVVLTREHFVIADDVVTANVDFKVRLLDPEDSGRMEISVKTYTFSRSSSIPAMDSKYVPRCFYAIVTELARGAIREVANDSLARSRIQKKVESLEKGASVESLSFESKPIAEGVFRGECLVACNGWEGFKTSNWAKSQIVAESATKLGVPEKNVRVIYDRNEVGSEKCHFSFRTFARRDFVMQYDDRSYRGSVIADPELMQITQGMASDEITKRIVAEMRIRGGVIDRHDADTKSMVRLGKINTDPTYGLFTVDFELVH